MNEEMAGIIQARENSFAIVSNMFDNDGSLKQDSIAPIVSGVIESFKKGEAGSAVVKLDSIIATEPTYKTVQMDGVDQQVLNTKGISLSSILTDVITVASQNAPVTVDSVTGALNVIGSIMSDKKTSAMLDSVQGVHGKEILTSLIAVNAYSILSSTLEGFDGFISDLQQDGATKNGNLKLTVYSKSPVVVKGMGDLADGEELNTANTLAPMALSRRDAKMEVVAGTKVYTYDVKALAGGDNFPMEMGVTEVEIGGTDVVLTDYDESPKAVNPTPSVTLPSGETIKAELRHAEGKIIVTFSDEAPHVGETIYISTGLSMKKLIDITGTVGIDITPYTYVAKGARIGTEVDFMSLRTALASTNINILSDGLRVASGKIAQEMAATKLDCATKYAKKAKGDDLDLTSGTYSTYAEAYKAFVVKVAEVGVEILTDSQITKNVGLVGGAGLEAIVNTLSTLDNNTLANKSYSEDNSIRKIGTIDGVNCYFDPRHDIKYPKDANGYERIDVIGVAQNVTKRASQSGVGLPFVPVNVDFNDSSLQSIFLEGKPMVEANKDPRAKKLSRYFLIKR